jgi:predicted SprT family Zn-dependent metalloprotease
VRMLLPPVERRREMDRNLVEFFRADRATALRQPRIEWYEYIDWGKTAGRTFEDGRIHLVHPENWKRGRIYKSERMWVQTVYHELAHYLFWTDAERKAEAFTHRMVRGLRRTPRRASVAATRRVAAAKRTASGRISAPGRAASGSFGMRTATRRATVATKRRSRKTVITARRLSQRAKVASAR